jgi:purine-binding chemotaxis protein CheW
MLDLVVFRLDDLRIALHLRAVDRVVRAVYVTPLPKAPDIVLGVVNVQGRIIPVVDIRRRFRLPDRAIALTDQLVISHTMRRPVALVADAVMDVLKFAEQDIVGSDHIVPGIERIDGVVKLEGELILIHDLDRFLSLEEEESLQRAMENA